MVHADALAILDAAHKVHPSLNPAMKEFVRQVEDGEPVTHEIFHSVSATLTEAGFTARGNDDDRIWYDPPPGRDIVTRFTVATWPDGDGGGPIPRDDRTYAIADACRMYVWAWENDMLL